MMSAMMMASRSQIIFKQIYCNNTSHSYLIFGLDFDTYLFDVEDSGQLTKFYRKDRAKKIATSSKIQNKHSSLAARGTGNAQVQCSPTLTSFSDFEVFLGNFKMNRKRKKTIADLGGGGANRVMKSPKKELKCRKFQHYGWLPF